ncbi:unnamed protein product [Somion occarium]|uniref:NYN domain-containing protein n=1 Tax=Somion occarium TaxID=3059160 RepID=A0ABP1DBY3_9APHY
MRASGVCWFKLAKPYLGHALYPALTSPASLGSALHPASQANGSPSVPPRDPVAIFWDWENCQTAANNSYRAAQRLRDIGQKYGPVTVFKSYVQAGQPSYFCSGKVRLALHTSGVHVLDCQLVKGRNLVDQTIIEDMLSYAVDNPAPATVILVSGDGHFGRALALLNQRRYRVVLVHPSKISNRASIAQATNTYSWDDVVWQKTSPEETVVDLEQPTANAVPPSRARKREEEITSLDPVKSLSVSDSVPADTNDQSPDDQATAELDHVAAIRDAPGWRSRDRATQQWVSCLPASEFIPMINFLRLAYDSTGQIWHSVYSLGILLGKQEPKLRPFLRKRRLKRYILRAKELGIVTNDREWSHPVVGPPINIRLQAEYLPVGVELSMVNHESNLDSKLDTSGEPDDWDGREGEELLHSDFAA